MSSCPKCETETVNKPPITRVVNIYHPRIVNIIHEIEIVRRHHCRNIPRHLYNVTVRDEFVD